MLWKTHLTTSACIGLPILCAEHKIINIKDIIHSTPLHAAGGIGIMTISIGGLLFGSLLPDIDEPNSKVAKWTTMFVDWIKDKIGSIKDRIMHKDHVDRKEGKQKPLLVIRIINKVLGHRGAVHSLLAIFLLMVLTNLSQPIKLIHLLLASITLGFALHLLEDYFSYMGIKWFCPIWDKDFKVPYALRYKVGGVKESIILVIGLIILIQEIGVIFININLFKIIT